MKKHSLIPIFLFLVFCVNAQETLTPELLWKLGRLGGIAVSPDGKQVVYDVNFYDLKTNKGNKDLYLLDLSKGSSQKITSAEGNESHAAWSPDGKRIGYTARENDQYQLWEMNPDGSQAKIITDAPRGIQQFSYAPDGKSIAYTSDVKIDSTVNDLYPDLPKAQARIIDELNYRHWDSWHDFSYTHLFVKKGETVKDIMEGEPFDAGAYSWSPDARLIAYSCKKEKGTAWAVSTNTDIYLYDLEKGSTTNITSDMKGYDNSPVFSPDGKHIAWLSMARPGFEADRNRVFLYDVEQGSSRELTVDFDQSASGLVWAKDGKTIYFISGTQATYQVYTVDIATGKISQLTQGIHNYKHIAIAGNQLIGEKQSMSMPSELFSIDPQSGKEKQLTFINKEVWGKVETAEVKKRIIKTTDGKDMLVWVIYPPDFDSSKKYPALLYCQGGPQSAVSQFFSYRWNFQLMAAGGYIVVAPNRRGLPTFGQEWNNQISGDWGGQNMKDYLSAIDAVAKEPYVDENRLGAVGASYGGYSTYWLAGNHDKRFKTFISHCGLYNLESWYGSTEEYFFANFDLEGAYWQSPEPKSYRQFSPHRFVGKWDTPMLVIHGQKDFRVPVTQGMEAFHAAQLRGIPSRFLYFPDEGHWVLQPQNGVLWHRVFFDWLDKYLKE